ncbi:MAG: hypothetical protein IPP35_10310 [Elusimicrobia bacterium]|nr:hypothetical protein [Elusimicrobiota bacterium]
MRQCYLAERVLNFYNKKVKKFIWFLLAVLLVGCGRDEMQTYRVPKEPEATLPLSGEMPPSDLPGGHVHTPPGKADLPPGHPEIGNDMGLANAAAQGLVPPSAPSGEVTWTTPRGWVEKPGSGFRYASFVVPGPEGLTGDLSVTVLEGGGGDLLANVNRWRGQIGLADLSADQLPTQTQSIHPAGRAMTLVDFLSEGNLIDGKYKKRLLSAVFSSDGKTWFFKLVGEDRLVESAKGDFLKFLESLKGL